MLKNKIIFKRIRNICILVMAVAILVGTYTYVRRSRAENVIQVELEVSDKSEILEPQTMIVDATETEDGNYLLELPTAVNGNIVTKYYIDDDSEVDMNDENADKTLTLTETEVSEQKMQLQTDYDKKEVTTEDGQTITLYNKELMDVKDTEEDANAENAEGADNEIQENENQTNEEQTNEATEEVTTGETAGESTNESTDETANEEQTTDQKTELDDTVVVTGYMPLESQVDIQKMDVSTMNVQLPNDTQTIQNAYEVSVYQTVRRIIDADGNVTSEEVVMPENKTENTENDTTAENETAENDTTAENETVENENTNTQENTTIEDINSENARENENVTSVTEATTPDNTTITTIILNDGTRIEEEKIEYDPSVYNEQLTIKTKNTEENTTATIYELQDDNQVIPLESTTEEDYVDTTIQKDNQVVRLALATEPISQNEVAPNSLDNDSGIATMALTDGNMLMSTSTETDLTSGFLGNTSIQRGDIDNVIFVSSTSGANSTAWDVSEEQNGSIMAWYETKENNKFTVYIGSNETIYANIDSSYLFANIGSFTGCEEPNTIENLDLLNTSKVTNMSYMFFYTGMYGMKTLDLGDNFDTSNVTNMAYMFGITGYNLTSVNLGAKFDTSNVTDMRGMFSMMGRGELTSLDLGPKFTNIAEANSQIFSGTGKSGIVIRVPEAIYQDSTHFKLNETSTTTIEFTGGTIEAIQPNSLRSTSSETSATSGFLGNTSIQRQNIDNVTFVDSISDNIKDGLVRSYNATNNTGNGHNNSTTTWKDLSGNQDGTIHGATWSDDHLSFDGVDDWAYLGVENVTNEVTMDATIVAKEIPQEYNLKYIITNIESGGTGLVITSEGFPALVMFMSDDSYLQLQSTEQIKIGEKTRITGTYDGTTARLYVNGELKAQQAQTGTIKQPLNNTVWVFGCNPNGSVDTDINGYMNMDVYSGKVYNKAISTTEVTAWDVSEEQNDSIMAWYETNANGTYKVYIGSDETIYANPDSSYLFSYIGYSGNCTSAETITNLGLLHTGNVQNMSWMFNNTGWTAMTSLNLGNFDTSNVQNMIGMFYHTGNNKMTSLDLGENFDTKKVLQMNQMFDNTGRMAMASFDLGDKFDTSNVTNMKNMFSGIGNSKLTSLDLGELFDTSQVTDMYGMFYETGYTSMTSLDLGDKFDTSNVTDMTLMFQKTGYTVMTSLDLGDKFDTSNVTEMYGMFWDTGYTAMTSLDLGAKFNTSKATDMRYMFERTGNISMTNLDLGPAFINIASTNTNMFNNTGKSGCIIQAPEAIYQNSTTFKLNTGSSTTISFTRGTINPKYRTEWVKESTSVDTTDANNPKLKITLRGTTNPEAGTDYISNLTSTLTTDDIKVYIDGEVEVKSITKTLGTATTATNPTTGAQDVIQELTLSNFEESTIDVSQGYKKWSGNVRILIAQGNLFDTTGPADVNGNKVTYGNANMSVTSTGGRTENRLADEEVDRNTPNTMFIDYIKPAIIYQYVETDIDHEGKTFTMKFDITDRYNDISSQLSLEDLTIRIDGEEPDWAKVEKSLQVDSKIVRIVGGNVRIGNTYTLTLSNLEQLQKKDGDNYLDYSGVVTVAIPANIIIDKSGNGNNGTTITSGISLPGGTGTGEVVDMVDPLVEKVSSSVDVDAKTATIKFRTTDKYFAQNNILNKENIQVLVNGSVNTSIVKTMNYTTLTEQRLVNGVTSTVQYGYEYNLTLTGIDTTVNQIKIRIPAGAITDTSGNGNEQTDLIVFNTLRSTVAEIYDAGRFLTNDNIQRQNIDNVTFVDHIPEDIYNETNNTYLNDTVWDVSAMGDNSILGWYEENANGTIKVYIGSNEDIYSNTDASYLFAWIGSLNKCTSTEIITNIELLNTSNVTNMSYMFFHTGAQAMTSLDLGDNFDTKNVTNMSNMFDETGTNAMTSLDLGDNFDTSNVTDMSGMFNNTGYRAMTSLDLGDNFDTSNVTNMSSMFYYTGYTAMTSLDLGDKFDTSNVTNMSTMFYRTGYNSMTSIDLGDKFDTSNVTDMVNMFNSTGYTAMTSLDLGDKFDTSNVTRMISMFYQTGYTAMTSLDLGPAFTYIPFRKNTDETDPYTSIFTSTGKSGCVIQAPEAIYQNSTSFKLNTNSSTTISYTRGTINPKYRTEWVKETVQTDTADTNNPKLNITLRGTTNTEVDSTEYISDVSSSLTANDIKIFIDDTEITDIVTKSIGTATTTSNTRTGATDVLQVLILSNFEEATRQTGKSYKEWSGNIRIEVAQGTLTDTTYGNKNMEVSEDGARADNQIEDETKVEQNTTGAMFADFIKPEFTYTYSSTDINHEEKTLTVEFSVTDKYFNTSIGLTNADGITVKMLDTNAVPENITNTITKVEDINENRNGTSVKIGEKYRLVVSGFEQASIENGKYKEYSGPVSIAFPAGIASDKSGNTNTSKTITVGINEPDQTGEAEIVDVVSPMWEAKNINIDKENDKVTVELHGTDKYYANNALDVSKIKVIIDGEEITSTTNVTKQLSAPTVLNENRDGATVPYGVKYTLTLSNWIETDEAFETSGRIYREYSGNVELQIEAGTLVDESGNENIETTLDLGLIDFIKPEIRKVSSTKNDADKTETIVFDVIDKYFESAQISTTDTSRIHVYVDNEEAIGVTKTITNEQDITAMVNGTSKVVGKRYTLVISNFEQERTTPVNYDREYSDWSGDVFILIEPVTAKDESGNTN